MATLRELLIHFGAIGVVDPVVENAYLTVLHKKFIDQDGDNPHGRPWHVSFHASAFPGDQEACPRAAMYGMMDIPMGGPPERWLATVAEAGKSVELGIVRKIRDAGFLVRSNQPGRSSDPEAVTEDGRPAPQMGFVEEDTWLTGSVDMPMLPYGYNSPHIVEIKSKHESDIALMQEGMKTYNQEHRHQLLCSLGMAHDHPEDFKHPTEDRTLEPATDGSIYYNSRDTKWPGPVQTHEFYFEYDAGFMEAGREQLRMFRKAFIEGELPQAVPRKNTRTHPNGSHWKWSEGQCKYCPAKKICRADYNSGTVNLAESTSIAVARFTRPGYDYSQKRARVFAEWSMQDPLAP